MEDTCLNCGKEFERKEKGFERKSIDTTTQIPVLSFRKILNESLNATITPEKKIIYGDKCASVCVKVKQFESAKAEYVSQQSKTSYLGKRSHSTASATTSTPSRNTSQPFPLFLLLSERNRFQEIQVFFHLRSVTRILLLFHLRTLLIKQLLYFYFQ